MSNSSLVTYTRISPNRNSPRNQPITKITVHHMAGVMTVEQFGNIVANPSREMSANYAIGNDGRIGLFCPEADRSWCSSSPWNDNRAITIEVSNSAYGDASGWPIGDKAYNSLIKLCVDICKRNGIKKLEFTGDKNGSLTFHYMFAATACPGPWMKAHAQDLCDKVNAQLTGSTPTPTPQPSTSYTVSLKASDLIYGTPGGRQTGTVGANGVFTIVEDKWVSGVKYGKLKSGAGWVIVAKANNTNTSTSFKTGDLVKIASNAVYYTGGGIPEWVKRENWYISSISNDRAVLGQNEAKNRNIQSPISTKYLTKVSGGTTTTPIKVGDWVKVTNNIIYGTNKKFVVYVSKYKVLELKGDRAVISSDGKNVTTAISLNNIQKV
jgi:hypothetical protein